MTNQSLIDHVKRLDRLYVAACDDRDRWVADSTLINWKRWQFTRRRYLAAMADGERRFGLSATQDRPLGRMGCRG